MRRNTTLMFLLVIVALVASACNSSTSDDTTTTTLAPVTTIATTTSGSETTTTVADSTTTTEPGLEIANGINGLVPDDPDSVDRRVVVVKIDNAPAARPQSGLMDADIVYEILVEGGLTRFAAAFQSNDVEYVGPVRSGRPTDAEVIKPLDAAFQVSGAQPWVQDIFKAADVHILYDNGRSTWRENHRSAPHNLYSSTVIIREIADEKNWSDETPGNAFLYGDEPTESTTPATEIQLDWSDHPTVRWVWNGEVYERYNDDVPHDWVTEDGEEGIVTTPMVVVIIGDRYTASGSSGSSVPAIHTIGTGEAKVFRNGTVVEGTWTRDSITDMFTLTDSSGDPIVLPPSKMFVAIFPDNRTVSWS
jgi:Protein of unknown function (DUF3048) N-terminal domain/Protein of unknown function (DUF3048) C-terminal domain